VPGATEDVVQAACLSYSMPRTCRLAGKRARASRLAEGNDNRGAAIGGGQARQTKAAAPECLTPGSRWFRAGPR